MMMTSQTANRIANAVRNSDRVNMERERNRMRATPARRSGAIVDVVITGFSADNKAFLCKLVNHSYQAVGSEFTVYARTGPPNETLRTGSQESTARMSPHKWTGHYLKAVYGRYHNGSAVVTGWHTVQDFAITNCAAGESP